MLCGRQTGRAGSSLGEGFHAKPTPEGLSVARRALAEATGASATWGDGTDRGCDKGWRAGFVSPDEGCRFRRLGNHRMKPSSLSSFRTRAPGTVLTACGTTDRSQRFAQVARSFGPRIASYLGVAGDDRCALRFASRMDRLGHHGIQDHRHADAGHDRSDHVASRAHRRSAIGQSGKRLRGRKVPHGGHSAHYVARRWLGQEITRMRASRRPGMNVAGSLRALPSRRRLRQQRLRRITGSRVRPNAKDVDLVLGTMRRNTSGSRSDVLCAKRIV